jgi:hypothetical protein
MAMLRVNPKWLNQVIFDPRQKPHANHARVSLVASQIREELVGIKTATATATCKNLRKLLERFDEVYQNEYNVRVEPIEWKRTQQEPRDLIGMMIRVFEIPIDVQMTVNGDRRSAAFNSPYIPSADLNAKKRLRVDTYFPVYHDAATVVYTSAVVIALNVDRNFLGEKQTSIVQFDKDIDMPDAKKLSLVSIVIHHGSSVESGHYTAMLKKNGVWYHYDDVGPDMTRVGSFSDMITWRKGFVGRNCTVLFYSS